MRRITPLFLLILFAFSVFATPDSSPIDWKLSGRLFLDGGVYIHSPKELHAGGISQMSGWQLKSVSIRTGIPK